MFGSSLRFMLGHNKLPIVFYHETSSNNVDVITQMQILRLWMMGDRHVLSDRTTLIHILFVVLFVWCFHHHIFVNIHIRNFVLHIFFIWPCRWICPDSWGNSKYDWLLADVGFGQKGKSWLLQICFGGLLFLNINILAKRRSPILPSSPECEPLHCCHFGPIIWGELKE